MSLIHKYSPGVTCLYDVSVALACVRRSTVDGHVKRRLHGRLVETREHLTGVSRLELTS